MMRRKEINRSQVSLESSLDDDEEGGSGERSGGKGIEGGGSMESFQERKGGTREDKEE